MNKKTISICLSARGAGKQIGEPGVLEWEEVR